MKSVIATIIFAAAAIAAPLEARAVPTVGFALSNDQTGSYAGVTFPADGLDKSIHTLFAGSSVGTTGKIIASSAQLTQAPQGLSCVFKYNGVTANLSPSNTYVDLDGNPAKATPVNIDTATINCHV